MHEPVKFQALRDAVNLAVVQLARSVKTGATNNFRELLVREFNVIPSASAFFYSPRRCSDRAALSELRETKRRVKRARADNADATNAKTVFESIQSMIKIQARSFKRDIFRREELIPPLLPSRQT